MRTFVNSLRLVALIAGVAAIVGQLTASIALPTFRLWNFFGYFTIQSNVIVVVALAVTLVAALRSRRASPGVSAFRGAATVYIATTGVVYNALLADVDVSNSVPWSNDLLHKWIPLYMVLDWLLFSDRARLQLRHVLWFLVYPAAWLVMALVRGATDGWVPYPFLDPGLGYGAVALYCVGVAVFIGLMGVLVVGMSRLRIVKV